MMDDDTKKLLVKIAQAVLEWTGEDKDQAKPVLQQLQQVDREAVAEAKKVREQITALIQEAKDKIGETAIADRLKEWRLQFASAGSNIESLKKMLADVRDTIGKMEKDKANHNTQAIIDEGIF